MATSITHWIDGQPVASTSGRTLPVFNPATGEQTRTVGLANAREVDNAVASARNSADPWRASSLATRVRVLYRFRELLQESTDVLADLLTNEHGKITSDARGEVARGVEAVEYAAGIPQLLKGEYSEQVSTGVDVYSIRQPIGVVAGITPFNFPVMAPLWMCANAIACGNTFILKPSEKDPSASYELGRTWKEAGLPDGVFNVLQGDREAVDALLSHDGISGVSFIGSTPVAREIYRKGAAAGKRVQALGGAKNHMVVMPDADVAAAADAALSSAFEAAGQRCMAVSVIVAVDDVADSLVEAIRERTLSFSVGDGSLPGSDFGPLISKEAKERVSGFIDSSKDDGATVVADGRDGNLPAGGYFLRPTLIDNVTTEMSVYQEEVFGPLLSVVRCKTYEEAVRLVNDHALGNGTAIFTRDGATARRYQFDVKIGMVGINVPIPVPVSWFSFGGWKASLFGDTHMYGPEGINFFTRAKVVTSRWPAD